MKQNIRLILIGMILILGLSSANSAAAGETTSPPEAELWLGGAAGQSKPPDNPGLGRNKPGEPGFLMVNPLQFRPWSTTDEWAYYGANLYNPGSDFAGYYAALTLPNNVIITQVVVYFLDNSSSDMRINLLRCPSLESHCPRMTAIESYGASSEYRFEASNVIDYSEVDQQNYSYIIEVGIPAGGKEELRLSAVRIDYTDPTVQPPYR